MYIHCLFFPCPHAHHCLTLGSGSAFISLWEFFLGSSLYLPSALHYCVPRLPLCNFIYTHTPYTIHAHTLPRVSVAHYLLPATTVPGVLFTLLPVPYHFTLFCTLPAVYSPHLTRILRYLLWFHFLALPFPVYITWFILCTFPYPFILLCLCFTHSPALIPSPPHTVCCCDYTHTTHLLPFAYAFGVHTFPSLLPYRGSLLLPWLVMPSLPATTTRPMLHTPYITHTFLLTHTIAPSSIPLLILISTCHDSFCLYRTNMAAFAFPTPALPCVLFPILCLFNTCLLTPQDYWFCPSTTCLPLFHYLCPYYFQVVLLWFTWVTPSPPLQTLPLFIVFLHLPLLADIITTF